jgi:hypothetical protein
LFAYSSTNTLKLMAEQPVASAAPEGGSVVESGLNPTAQDALNSIDDFRAQEEEYAALEVYNLI